jgi:hypothetical protein
MPKSYVFTSNIPLELKEKIEQYSTKHHIPKNKVLEKALSLFFHEEKRKAFAEGIKKYGQNPENIEIAEWGMTDYAEQLKKYPR